MEKEKITIELEEELQKLSMTQKITALRFIRSLQETEYSSKLSASSQE